LSGVGNLALALLDKGAAGKNERTLALNLSQLAAEFEASLGRSNIGLQLDCPASTFLEALPLFLSMVQQPNFAARPFWRERDFMVRELYSGENQYELDCFNRMLARLFPDHAYGLNPLGDPAVLGKLKPQQVRQHYFTRLLHGRWTMAVVAPQSLRDIESVLSRHLRADLAAAIRQPQPLPLKSPLTEPLHHRIAGEKAYLAIGFRTGPLRDGIWPEIDLLTALLTGNGAGRLYHRLREELGLAYTVQSAAYHGTTDGYFSIYVNTSPQQLPRVQRLIDGELKKFCRHGATTNELKRAKNSLAGAYRIDLQRVAAQASQLAVGRQTGLGSDLNVYPRRIEAVGGGALRTLAGRVFRTERSATVVLLPGQAAAKRRSKLPSKR
jgi:predicted Zn-dependent peptidase